MNGRLETIEREDWIYVIHDVEELIINVNPHARHSSTTAFVEVQAALFNEYKQMRSRATNAGRHGRDGEYLRLAPVRTLG